MSSKGKIMSLEQYKDLVVHLYEDLARENKTGERCSNPDHWPPEDLAEAILRRYPYLFDEDEVVK